MPQNLAESPKLPPPSFALIVASFAAQASVALGHVPNPMTNKQEENLDLAKHAIDTLAILEQKTKGNLAPDEAAMLEDVLHQMRMAYLEAQKAGKA
ncbi:MAG TPA: DUF1844 domain-containing protein [Pirellulaceae bacterium]|nr:DUF1844 domain-containing protein [Pirellulaceae bacterium]